MSAVSDSVQLRIPEILAPAGGREQFFAALHAGADAVYLGLEKFNARARAQNFSMEDLTELLPIARRYGMRVLLTLNVVIKENEIADLVKTLARLEPLGVHALIVQDLGLARLVRNYFPSFRLHASTQMAVHNLAGVIAAKQLGFKRVVLARELTAVEIRKIREALPEDEVQLEAFCHGSLCYSYSGLCFFSGARDARSGNRGECAYTCRKPYKILNEKGQGFLFSMRDLDTSADLKDLAGSGIDALKIEGRKKDAQYVATSVRLYRKRLDEWAGRSTLRPEAPNAARELASETKPLEEDRALSFQRAGTTFFLKGRYFENVIDLDEPSHRGIRVGAIEAVEHGFIRLKTEIPLERYDGLRIDSPEVIYHAKPQHGEVVTHASSELSARFHNEGLRFSLRDMEVDRRSVPTAEAGETVEIALPEGEAEPKVGDLVYKIRSDELRRRVEKLARAPEDARLRPLLPVKTKIQILENGGALEITATLCVLEHELLSETISFKAERPRGNSNLARDLEEVFAIYGDAGFESLEVSSSGDLNWFLPKSFLKELKRKLSQNLPSAYESFSTSRTEKVLKDFKSAVASGDLLTSPERLSIKFDRLEFLDGFKTYLSSDPTLRTQEIVFEPKRMFLGEAKPEAVIETLTSFAIENRISLRLAIPTVLRAWEEPDLRKWLRAFFKAGENRFEVGNLGALEILRSEGIEPELTSDFTLYALNSEASKHWAESGIKRVSLSVEDDLENITSHLTRFPWREARPEAILYKDTPLFIAEACSLTALHNGCPGSKVCGYRSLEIENDEGERFIVAHEKCKSVVYGKEAFSLSQHRKALSALGVRDFRVDFLTRPYTNEEILGILGAVDQGKKIPGTHSANFERRLL